MGITTREEGEAFLQALESGELRAAAPDASGNWHVHTEVKQNILSLFKLSDVLPYPIGGLPFCDKDMLFPKTELPKNVRVVPGGSSIRRGSYVAADVVIMPPSYINVGAYVGAGTMVDSHALVGSCAQVGRNVHLSAAAQIGGVLEPIGALPIIIEDDAFIGGNCGVYEGVRVGQGAVLAAGVVLTASKPVFDLVNNRRLEVQEGILTIPPGAVVVEGARRIGGDFAKEQGLSMNAAMIVKYREEKTDARLTLEDALR